MQLAGIFAKRANRRRQTRTTERRRFRAALTEVGLPEIRSTTEQRVGLNTSPAPKTARSPRVAVCAFGQSRRTFAK